jgi:hypothetical protein
MNTRSAREYTMSEPAQLFSNWREQRPSNKDDRNLLIFVAAKNVSNKVMEKK